MKRNIVLSIQSFTVASAALLVLVLSSNVAHATGVGAAGAAAPDTQAADTSLTTGSTSGTTGTSTGSTGDTTSATTGSSTGTVTGAGSSSRPSSQHSAAIDQNGSVSTQVGSTTLE